MRTRGLGDVRAAVAVVVGAMGSAWLFGLPHPSIGSDTTADEIVAAGALNTPGLYPYPGRYHFEAMPERGGVAFHASSLGGGFAVQGDHGGRLARVGDDLHVLLSPALVRPVGSNVDGERLVGMRLALAEDTQSGWNITKRGPLTPVGTALVAGEDIWLSGLHLRLPDVSEEDMVGRWLVVVHELESRDESGVHKAWTYAHTDRETLARLMGWMEDGC